LCWLVLWRAWLPCSVDAAEVKHRQAECQEPSMLCCCLPQSTAYAPMEELVSNAVKPVNP
jgi:hypothetical protein